MIEDKNGLTWSCKPTKKDAARISKILDKQTKLIWFLWDLYGQSNKNKDKSYWFSIITQEFVEAAIIDICDVVYHKKVVTSLDMDSIEEVFKSHGG